MAQRESFDRRLTRSGIIAQPAPEETQTALVVKAISRAERGLEDPFGEIVALCDTAGARVVEAFAQNIDRVNAATYLGRGKIEELARRVEELDVDLVVTDNDLTPAQERNLEQTVKRTVIDRTQLILDIFARRASTLQAKLQVELAQLRYMFPRLKRMWTHLSRYEGGIGMRGPGETQLETDKRLIQRRIRILRRKLSEIEDRSERALSRDRRDLVIALVGYTNVGKSTLLNRLTSSRELVEDKLFATLDTRTRKWPIDGNRHVMVKDTIGFIRALPHHLVASFHATLAETRAADLLLHVVDASAVNARQQVRAVEDVLRQIECDDKPCWMLLNKFDRLSADGAVEARRLADLGPAGGRVFEISAASGVGIEAVRAAVGELLDGRNRRVSLLVPHSRGDLLAFVRRNGRVTAEETRDDGMHLVAELPPAGIAKLRALAGGDNGEGNRAGDGDGLRIETVDS